MYKTSDLGEASALVSTGWQLDQIIMVDEKRGEFSFIEEDGLGLAIDDYWHGRLLVEPKHYQNTLRELKTRVNGMIRHR